MCHSLQLHTQIKHFFSLGTIVHLHSALLFLSWTDHPLGIELLEILCNRSKSFRRLLFFVFFLFSAHYYTAQFEQGERVHMTFLPLSLSFLISHFLSSSTIEQQP